MIESARGLEWMRAALLANSTITTDTLGGIHRNYAPPGTATPYIILSHQGGSDVKGAPQYRLLNSSLYQAKVVGPATIYATLVTIADAIDTTLERAAGTTSDSIIYTCTREQPLEVDELVDGSQWSNIGCLYRILVSAA